MVYVPSINRTSRELRNIYLDMEKNPAFIFSFIIFNPAFIYQNMFILMNKHHICEHIYMKPGVTKKAFFETQGLCH